MIEKLKPDVVLNAMHGVDGLTVTKKALQKAKKVLIANKELLVSHGRELIKIAKKYKSTIVPVDSEITGILQCIQGENPKNIEKIILTCSGGPFYKKTKAQLKNVTREQALSHPTWNMGKKITIDSATLMNKGFELIVASHFFNIPPEKIEVVIHPQSIVHALIQWKDGNLTAALSPTNMRHTIQYALFFPERRGNSMPYLDITKFQCSFEKPNEKIFTTLALARKAAGKEKVAAKLCATNDEAVRQFLNGEIPFLKIFDILKK
jgi:1-deoxy-D-xylulose-5-phosphate reductoisomerase